MLVEGEATEPEVDRTAPGQGPLDCLRLQLPEKSTKLCSVPAGQGFAPFPEGEGSPAGSASSCAQPPFTCLQVPLLLSFPLSLPFPKAFPTGMLALLGGGLACCPLFVAVGVHSRHAPQEPVSARGKGDGLA